MLSQAVVHEPAHPTDAKFVENVMWKQAQVEFVRMLADLTLQFRRPVLLIKGDSHLFGADQPLADPASPTGQIHKTPPVPNLTRITVQGSTNKPREWLRRTVDPHSPSVFSGRNVIYCDDSRCPNQP